MSTPANTEQTPPAEVTKSRTPEAEARRSKVVVVGIVLAILGGWLAWNAWDFFGTEGLNPKKVKAMAKAYEARCYEQTKSQRFCKRHIGTHHRTCLPRGIDRAGPGEAARPIRYNHQGYAACVGAHLEEEWAAYQRKHPTPTR